MNAKQEFIQHVAQRKIKCASIQYGDSGGWDYDTDKLFQLTTGHTEQDYQEFIDSLDFEYDSGYGSQELFGIIWYEDGTWSDRGEYDGSEWWQHNVCPEIPEQLIRLDKERNQKLNKLLE